MIIRITAEGFELGVELDKYVHNKLEGLERYIARRDRTMALVEVQLQKASGAALQRTCDLTVKLPRTELHVRETTQHMYASLDVAVADMTRQLKDRRSQDRRTTRSHGNGRGSHSSET